MPAEVPEDLTTYLVEAPDAIVIVDSEAAIVFANRRAEELFGWDREQLVGQPVEMLVPQSMATRHRGLRIDYMRRPSQRLVTNPASRVTAVCADGSEVPVEIALSPVNHGGKPTVMAVIRNTEARAEMEAQRRIVAERERDRRDSLLTLLYRLRLRVVEATSRNGLLNSITSELASTYQATFAAVLLPTDDELRMTSYATPAGNTTPPAKSVPVGTSLSELFAADEVQTFPGPGPGTPEFVRGWLAGTAEVMLSGISVSDEVEGVVVMGRPVDSEPFDAVDRQILASVSRDAALSFQLGRARRSENRLNLTEERERIARELHDVVLQRLFAAGMGLQAASHDPATLARRAGEVVSELDEIVGVIRSTIFQLLDSGAVPSKLLRSAVHGHAIGEAADIDLQIDGPFDELDSGLVEDVIAVVGEALANVEQHASAATVSITATVNDELVTIEIVDDGIGVAPEAAPGFGSLNMAERAKRYEGSSEVRANTDAAGTTVRWVAQRR